MAAGRPRAGRAWAFRQRRVGAPPGRRLGEAVSGGAGPGRSSGQAPAGPAGQEFEEIVASFEEVVEFRRLFGRPDYFLRVEVADHAAYEAFATTKLSGLPGVLRMTSHLTMEKIKTDG
ncbi:Lrp/AsnC ligand binding domain-containing protein [Streptacidiphilus monticola]|uniref:Lrp/AsnC ligand binding domain-containing protein n=1 Tax=Streptacidiphilus monticola TaxID=2161674 RepID=A0ABW1G945_9ACTN